MNMAVSPIPIYSTTISSFNTAFLYVSTCTSKYRIVRYAMDALVKVVVKLDLGTNPREFAFPQPKVIIIPLRWEKDLIDDGISSFYKLMRSVLGRNTQGK